MRIPIGFLMQIDNFQELNKIKDRTAAIKQLLEVGLKVESMKEKVDSWTSQDMEDIKSQLNQGTLVDWIQNIDPKKLEILADIFKVEHEARQKQKKLPQY